MTFSSDERESADMTFVGEHFANDPMFRTIIQPGKRHDRDSGAQLRH